MVASLTRAVAARPARRLASDEPTGARVGGRVPAVDAGDAYDSPAARRVHEPPGGHVDPDVPRPVEEEEVAGSQCRAADPATEPGERIARVRPVQADAAVGPEDQPLATKPC